MNDLFLLTIPVENYKRKEIINTMFLVIFYCIINACFGFDNFESYMKAIFILLLFLILFFYYKLINEICLNFAFKIENKIKDGREEQSNALIFQNNISKEKIIVLLSSQIKDGNYIKKAERLLNSVDIKKLKIGVSHLRFLTTVIFPFVTVLLFILTDSILLLIILRIVLIAIINNYENNYEVGKFYLF